MAINFPNSPNLYQVYVDPVSKNSYVWTGDYWTGFTSTTSYQVGFNIASIVVEDDSSPVGVVSTLDFADNLDVVFSAGVATVTGAGGIATGFSTTASIDTTGIITASSFSGSGASLTGLTGASSGVYGDGEYVPQITVDSTGKIVGISTVAITVSGGGGGESYWSQTEVGIHTLSNVGIGTTNPTSALTVKGDTSLETLNVSGVSTFNGNLRTNGANIKLGDGNESAGNQIKLGNGVSSDAFGDSSDLWIYHNPSYGNLFQDITGTGVGVWTVEFNIANPSNPSEKAFHTNITAGTELYYNRNIKFETLGAGVTVTGTTFTNQLSASGVITASSFSGSGSGLTNLPSGQLTGALPAIDGSALLNITAVGSGIEIRDDGMSVGTASTVDFGAGLDVTFGSGIATVAVTSGIGTDDVRTNTLVVSGVTTTTNLSVLGVSTFQGNIQLGDNDIINIGLGPSGDGTSDGDIQIFHNGGYSYIINNTNNLFIQSTSSVDIFDSTSSYMGRFVEDDGVYLYFNKNKKFETTGAGITVTGTTFTNDLNVSGVSTFQNDTYFQDSTHHATNPTRAYFGSLDEMSIFSTGTYLGNSYNYIDANSGYLDIRNLRTTIRNPETATQRDLAIFDATTFNSEFVKLYYGGNEKFATLGAGITVTGTTFTNQLSVSGVSTFQNDLNINGDIYQNGVPLFSSGTLVGLGTFIAAVGVGHTIDSFVIATTDYKTVEYTLHVGFGSYIHAQKALIMQNGSNAYCQEYAIMGEPDILVSVNASVSSGVCSIYVVPEVGVTGLVTYRYNRTALL
jgi:hypothetical protein